MAVSGTPSRGKARARRVGSFLHTALAVALTLVIAALLHYVAATQYRRWDVSRSGIFSLSEKSLELLQRLDREVEAVVFFESGHELYRDVDTLLREYDYGSPRFRVRRVDPDRDPGSTEELIRRFPVTERNVVVFHADDRSRIVRAADLADFVDAGPDGRHRRMAVFRGEPLFSSAILAVTQAYRPRVVFLTGQGEKSIEDTDASTGLSTLARLIRQDNVDVQTHALAESSGIPSDTDALIVAGPRHRFPQPLLERIAEWLDERGRALFLLDSGVRTGLESVLEQRGVRVGDDRVVDPGRTVTGREILVLRYGAHPITERLHGVTSVFYLPRSVAPADDSGMAAADRPRVTRLALTSDESWAERDYEKTPMVFDPGRDRPGPVSIAAAVERGALRDVDAELQPGRWVVFGDSSFVANGRLTGGNADLFLGALNWLLDREELMALSPRTVETVRLPLSAAQMQQLGWLVIGVLPGAAAVLGIAVRLRRRH